jgi:hypothetical protein
VFHDEHGSYPAGSWLRSRAGAATSLSPEKKVH